ncbi:hypothetical protein BaRGS_00028495 [Batillaria attramentaria]|uniref:Uncharacterized protein n=1 Tax=Batillaria attramentaria TaxID=370345 RepID=A0ABD0JAM7_9CAEN
MLPAAAANLPVHESARLCPSSLLLASAAAFSLTLTEPHPGAKLIPNSPIGILTLSDYHTGSRFWRLAGGVTLAGLCPRGDRLMPSDITERVCLLHTNALVNTYIQPQYTVVPCGVDYGYLAYSGIGSGPIGY